MSIAFSPSLSPGMSRELFHQTYLSSSRGPDKGAYEGSFSLPILLDTLVGFMRIPYLYIEIRRIQKVVDEGGTLKSSSEFRYQALSTFANAVEICLWFYDRKYVILSKKCAKILQRVCYLSKMVLYEQAVRKEATLFIHCQREKRVRPEIVEKKEYKQLKVSLISHTAFLGWVTMRLISHTTGTPFPRRFLEILHLTSFSFGLIAMGYDERSEIREFFRMLSPYLPNGQIY